MTNYQKGVLLTFLGASCWGLSGVLGEYLLNVAKLDSIWVISNRLFYSGLLMLIYVYFQQRKEIFIPFKYKRDIIKLINFSFLGLVICQGTYFLAIKYTNAGTATVLQYLGPTIIMLYYCLKKKRFPIQSELFAILLSLVGVFLIATHFDFDNIIISKEGLFWGIFSALGLATYNILSIDLIKKYGSFLTVAWGLFLAGVVIQFFTRSFYIPSNFNILVFLAMIGVILIGTIVSFTIYLQGVTLIGAVKGSIIACFEPIAAILFSYLLIGTHFSLYDIIGSCIILIAVLILNRK